MVENAKRRRTTTPAVQRKRIRTSLSTNDDDGVRSASSKRRREDQYTLTQIDFVKSSPLDRTDDVLELAPISYLPRVQPQRIPLNKRDSTLTQMDFFGAAAVDESSLLDDSLLQLKDVSTASEPHNIASFDGAASECESRTLQATEMLPPRPSHRNMHGHKPTIETTTMNSPEYQRRKRRKVDQQENTTEKHKRFAERTNSNTIHSKKPSLVIQDSTDFDEVTVPEEASRLQRMVHQPSTPQKTRDRIPSSQTPESIQPSTRKRAARKPLAELSTNLPQSPSKSSKSKTFLSAELSPPKRSAKRSKICVLKIPTKTLPSRTSRQDDSQQDIWSLHATSSPRSGSSGVTGKQERFKEKAKQHQHPIDTEDDNSYEESTAIEESSNIQRDVDTQKSLPDLSDIFPDVSTLKRTRKSTSNVAESLRLEESHKATETGVVENIGQTCDMLLQQEPINMIPEFGQIESDALSDLGDPVANDTQFVKDLQQRISSPPASSKRNQQQFRAATEPATRQPHSPVRYEIPAGSNPVSPILPSPLPPPQLVPSPDRTVQRQTSDSNLPVLPPTVHVNNAQQISSEKVRITQVPLNDTNEYRQLSSSSPALPSATMAVQRGMHPASLPRPSQVSTQAPSTQGYLPSSPVLYSQNVSKDSEVERITIKDSSSIPARLSQVPRHECISLNEDDDLNAYTRNGSVDASHEDDEFDLDPSTFRHPASKLSPDSDAEQKEQMDEVTQTPTQWPDKRLLLKRRTTTQSSPILLGATTRSQRDAELEVIALASSPVEERSREDPWNRETNLESPSSSILSNLSPSPPRTLKRKYTPIPGFDNDTQSDFTQGGHVTAAYIHRAHEEGWLPKKYIPKPYKVKNWSKSMYEGSKSKKGKEKRART